MNSLNKKIILIVLVVTEIVSGSYFIYQYQQYKIRQNNILGASKISIIDKTKTIMEPSNELKHYWKFIPNQEQEDNPDWLPYKAIYNINSDGLNDLNNYPIKKEENIYRIITLGDSFTYGHYVNTKDNWTEQLEVLLNNSIENCQYKKIEVINLGMPGYDIQYIVQRYKEIGQKYEPDLVLWFDSGSGFFRFNELAKPIVDECYLNSPDFESVQMRTGYNMCTNETREKIKEAYSRERLNQLMEDQYDIFFKLIDQKKVSIYYYEWLSKENLEIVEKWKSKYAEAVFTPTIPHPTEKDKLADNHPNRLGHIIIANSIFEHLDKQILCK